MKLFTRNCIPQDEPVGFHFSINSTETNFTTGTDLRKDRPQQTNPTGTDITETDL
jgi:hypothetical protein